MKQQNLRNGGLLRCLPLLAFLLSFGMAKSNAQTYCNPSYPSGCFNWGTNSVTIGSFQHNPVCNTSDYTAQVINLIAGDEIEAAITTIGWTGVGVAVDFNSDGDFEDAEEVLAVPPYADNGSTEIYELTFTIPAWVVTGDYRLRIWNREANANGPDGPEAGMLPCGTFGYGRFQDYTLAVTNLNSCNPPSALMTGTILPTGADFSWTATISADVTYEWVVVADGDDPETAVPVATSTGAGLTANPTGLAPVTSYTFYVRTICSATEASAWYGALDFTTPCDGTPTAGTITSNAISVCAYDEVVLTLSGASEDPGITYQWQSSPAGENTFTDIAAATNSTFDFTGQTSATDYQCVVTCTGSGLTAIAEGIAITQVDPSLCLSPTYTDGDIATLLNYAPDINTASTCPGVMTITVPSGYWVTGMTTSYNMSTASNGWKSEQRSYIGSPELDAEESQLAMGSGNSEGTMSYTRELTFANEATGTFSLELHAFRTYGSSGCGTSYNKVDNGTWNVSVSIAPIPTCMKPVDIAIADLGPNGANLAWAAPGQGTEPANYGYEIRTSGDPGSGAAGLALNGDNITDLSVALTGLAPETAYSAYVHSNCGGGDFSAWTNAVNFTTTVSCAPPVDVHVTMTSATVASLNWSAPVIGNEPEGYVYEIRTSGAVGSGTEGLVGGGAVTATTLDLAGIVTPGAVHTMYVRTACGGTDNSVWSAGVSFEFPEFLAVELSGYNEDVIANGIGDANASTTAPVDGTGGGANFAYMAADFQVTEASALQTNVFPMSRDLYHGNKWHRMADYSQNNSLRLDNTNNGILTFVAPQFAQSLCFLTVGGNGAANYNVTINFTDGSSQESTGLNAPDWSGSGWIPLGRVSRVNNTTAAGGFLVNDNTVVAIDEANQGKLIESVHFTKTNAGGSVLNVFGITRMPSPCTEAVVATISADNLPEQPTACGAEDGAIVLEVNLEGIYNINYTKNGASEVISDISTTALGNEYFLVLSNLGAGTYTNFSAAQGVCGSNLITEEVVLAAPGYTETAMAAICAGGTYSFGTQTLTEAGDYSEIFTAEDGCDSTVTLTLTVTPLALATTSVNTDVEVTGTTQVADACLLLGTVTPNGASPLSGNLSFNQVIDAGVMTYEGAPYLQRHFDIEPDANPESATATITLYFTQADFDAYNNFVTTNSLSLGLLPTSGVDNGNLTITQYHGTGTSPGNYTGTTTLIIPTLTWDVTNSWWVATFDVIGFSGFYAHSGGVPLAISLYDFTARNQGTENILNWKATTTETADRFLVERSADSRAFNPIGTVNSTNNLEAYTFTDQQPLQGLNYYRLQLINADGKINYSQVVSVMVKGTGFNVQAFPNPTKEKLTVTLGTTPAADAQIRITDATGRTVRQVAVTAQEVTIDLKGLAEGIYLMHYQDKAHTATIKVHKQ